MQRSKNNIVLLVLFHVVVLLFPLVAKGLHHHEHHTDVVEWHHHGSVVNSAQSCVICDFEYAHVISPDGIQYASVFNAVSVYRASIHLISFSEAFPYYSLRAPPVV